MNTEFGFFMPAKVIGGKNALEKGCEVFCELGKKCLIVTGKSSAKKSGALDDVESILKGYGIEYKVFDGISENPSTVQCCLGGKSARDMQADFIIGIGGGSPLDGAKAVCVYAANEDITDDEIYEKPVVNSPLPLVLIGTTAGTGSEVSGVSVLTGTNGRKKSVGGKNYYADYVFADPRYTYSVPLKTTISTALDALAHCVESMFSPRADYLSQRFALMASGLIYPCLRELNEGKEPDFNMRDTLYFASLYAGFALNTGGTGFPHGMGYALTEDYGIPHGLACAVFLPAYLKEAKKANPALFDELLTAVGAEESEVSALISALSVLPVKISAERAGEYELRWRTLKNFKNSPTDFNSRDAQKLLLTLFGN